MRGLRGLTVLSGLPGIAGRMGRHRRPDPPVRVTLVLAGGDQVAVPPDSALARSMGQVAALLAHW